MFLCTLVVADPVITDGLVAYWSLSVIYVFTVIRLSSLFIDYFVVFVVIFAMFPTSFSWSEVLVVIVSPWVCAVYSTW